jgi:alkylation response protein AidB-like acyl-CoA dehydrogenase
VTYPAPFEARTERARSLVARATEAAAVATQHATRHDREGTFPVEGLAELARSGYLAAVIPSALGGEDAGVSDYLLGNLALAKGDAALGLVVSMHCTLLGRVRDANLWPAETFERVAHEVVAARDGHGALINSLATEPDLGSPSRGGLPGTRAERTTDGWRINGRKTFSSGSPVLRWGVIAAAVTENDKPRIGNFLVPLNGTGVRIEPSWDTLGMRATGSDTVVLEDVVAPAEAELPRVAPAQPGRPTVPYERAWSLIVTAVYLGVAEAARDFAVAYARDRRPTALKGATIGSLPHIRQRAAQLDSQLYAARGLLLGTAQAWGSASSDEERAAMEGALSVAKMHASNAAVAVAEGAMRLVGGSSMDRGQPLERHFRDVRGGLHHPPQDDATMDLLARDALD